MSNEALHLISKYGGYFHDGSIHQIKYQGKEIVISMESAELLEEWDWDRVGLPLSKRGTICGTLHFMNVKSITRDALPFHEILVMVYDDCTIYHLEINNNTVMFSLIWESRSPSDTIMADVEIEASKVYWEHSPNLCDRFWEEDENH